MLEHNWKQIFLPKNVNHGFQPSTKSIHVSEKMKNATEGSYDKRDLIDKIERYPRFIQMAAKNSEEVKKTINPSKPSTPSFYS